MRPHERLEVWRMAVEFTVSVYKATDSFPGDERFGLTSQVRRAAVSVAANIAEGAGRNSSREFAYFLSNAQGSASELATELLIAHRLLYLKREQYEQLMRTLDSVGRMIVGLSRNVRAKSGDK
jgi:four helix bundle protein